MKLYRMDGSMYPETEEGTLEWAQDMGQPRHVGKTLLWNGLYVSTVWLGIDHSFDAGPIKIFETMIFDHLIKDSDEDTILWRYSTYEEACQGHAYVVNTYKSIRYNFKRFLNLLRKEVTSNV